MNHSLFLMQNRDEQVLDHYLKLLAFTAQQTNSEQTLIELKFENAELKTENTALRDALEHSLDDLLTNDNSKIQAEINAKINQFLLQKGTTLGVNMLRAGGNKFASLIDKTFK